MRPAGSDPCAVAAGRPGSGNVRGGPQNSLRAFGASFKQPRPVRSRSGCILRCSRHPAHTPTQAHPEGVEVHTGHRCARPGEPSPLPSPRGRGRKTRVRRMVVGLCLCPCLRLGVGWCGPDAGLIEREDRSMRHACCAFSCSRGAGRSTKARSVGQGLPGQAQPERWLWTSPSTAPGLPPSPPGRGQG